MTETFEDTRASVRALYAACPGEYWQRLDATRTYPEAFVNSLTQAGYLAALILEEYGGSGLGLPAAAAILEEIQRSGCNGGACHTQMYTMGTVLRHGSPQQNADLFERKFRETRLYQVAPISTNLILAYLAEHVLELPRSY